jgi:hypothetical protein
MAPPNPRVADLMSELEAVAELVAEARRGLAEGALLDLAGLEDRVGRLCEALTTLPRPDAGSFAEPMTALVSDLDALVLAVKTQYQEFSENGEADSDPGRVMRAYGQKPPGKPPGPKG